MSSGAFAALAPPACRLAARRLLRAVAEAAPPSVLLAVAESAAERAAAALERAAATRAPDALAETVAACETLADVAGLRLDDAADPFADGVLREGSDGFGSFLIEDDAARERERASLGSASPFFSDAAADVDALLGRDDLARVAGLGPEDFTRSLSAEEGLPGFAFRASSSGTKGEGEEAHRASERQRHAEDSSLLPSVRATASAALVDVAGRALAAGLATDPTICEGVLLLASRALGRDGGSFERSRSAAFSGSLLRDPSVPAARTRREAALRGFGSVVEVSAGSVDATRERDAGDAGDEPVHATGSGSEAPVSDGILDAERILDASDASVPWAIRFLLAPGSASLRAEARETLRRVASSRDRAAALAAVDALGAALPRAAAVGGDAAESASRRSATRVGTSPRRRREAYV